MPIVTWCWNKLGVDVICFAPNTDWNLRACLVFDTLVKNRMRYDWKQFDAPKDKQATYAQCSRLYAANTQSEPYDVLVTSDIDMAVFNGEYFKQKKAPFDVFGADLVPLKQLPLCYISATVIEWRKTFTQERGYQQCLDDLLGEIEVQNFRGNYWSKDQEEAYKQIVPTNQFYFHNRTNGQNQFATKRIDRDDSYWEERLSPDIIDAHLWRPGYTDENFEKIIKLLTYFYPYENFEWLIDYRLKYCQLL